MVVDNNISWIGTSNWEPDYFKNSRNIGMIIKGDLIVRQLAEIFGLGWNGPYSEHIDPDKDYPLPRISE